MIDPPGAIPEVPFYVVVSFLNSLFSKLLSSTSVQPKFKSPLHKHNEYNLILFLLINGTKEFMSFILVLYHPEL